MTRQTKLAHHEHVERRVESFRHFRRDRHATSGKRQHENVLPVCVIAEIFSQNLAGFSSINELCFHIVRESCLTTATNRREAEYQKLRMPRLPMVEIDAEASDVLAAHVALCVHQLKQFFRFVTVKELGIQKLGHPIHLMSVGEIEGDLDVFVGILNHDDAVVVNVCALPFALEEDCATRLYFGRSELGRLKK